MNAAVIANALPPSKRDPRCPNCGNPVPPLNLTILGRVVNPDHICQSCDPTPLGEDNIGEPFRLTPEGSIIQVSHAGQDCTGYLEGGGRCPECAQGHASSRLAGIHEARAAMLAAIPDAYADAHFDENSDPQLRQWAATARGWLLIQGPVGVGKTYAAWAAWRAIASVAERPMVVECYTGQQLPKVVPEADVVIVDDLEKPGTTWTGERLFSLLDDRYTHRRTTILTTNLPLSLLGDSIGERLASRILESATVVSMTGANRRGVRDLF